MESVFYFISWQPVGVGDVGVHLGGVCSTVDDEGVRLRALHEAEHVLFVDLVAEEVVDVGPLLALVEELVEIVVVRLEFPRVPVVPFTRVDLTIKHEVIASTAIGLAEDERFAKHY